MKPEKAIFVETIAGLDKASLSGYSRLYFGHETCDRQIPSLAEMKQAKKVCGREGLSFSLVSPFCTNSGLRALLPLLKALSGSDELIANDFGVLYVASKKSRAEVVCGRLLNRQYRDPRIALFRNAPLPMQQHLRSSHASSQLFQQLLKRFNVRRVELDNLLQGIGTNVTGNFSASLYHPLVFVSATRFCLAANCDRLSFAKKIGIFPCGKECEKYGFRLENEQFGRLICLFGNALYFENKTIPKELHSRGIDRLVFTAKEV